MDSYNRVNKELEKYLENELKNTKNRNTLIKLKYLRCFSAKIATIPNTFINLKTLSCGDSNINMLPKELINLEYLEMCNCKNIKKNT